MRLSSEKKFSSLDLDDQGQIILLNWEGRPSNYHNLVRVSKEGMVLWVAGAESALDGVFTSIDLDNDVIKAYNYNGYLYHIDLETGKIISRSFVK
jgi:hypothetical protein